jgi:ATP-dependent DNA helicase RecQ
VERPADKYAALGRYLERHAGSGIVYCSTRKEVERVCARLLGDGLAAARYHAGLSPEERSRAQDDFLFDRVRVIVATNAFGMGIDKSNVRFVIHYNMPQNLESYYQEAGRAGRDGLSADCILLYAGADVRTALFLIGQSDNPQEVERNEKLLWHMQRYCTQQGCLRRYILDYFGERGSEKCGNCSVCKGAREKPTAPERAKRAARKVQYDVPEELFARLKALRAELAKQAGVPAYVIFSDATLVEMCKKRPRNEQEMLEVSGVGSVNWKRYAQHFLRLLVE